MVKLKPYQSILGTVILVDDDGILCIIELNAIECDIPGMSRPSLPCLDPCSILSFFKAATIHMYCFHLDSSSVHSQASKTYTIARDHMLHLWHIWNSSASNGFSNSCIFLLVLAFSFSAYLSTFFLFSSARSNLISWCVKWILI